MKDEDSNLEPGDNVHIISLNKRGQVERVLKGDKVKVIVSSMTLQCHKSDLKLTAKKMNLDRGVVTMDVHKIQRKSKFSLDLHGTTVREAIEKTEDAINKAILAGADQLEIIHGIGTGALQKALAKYLSSAPGVASAKLDPNNIGTTIVYL